ncbi:cell wall hydrolase [Larsenimonas rhizosphaerae]|uniref:Cell wall hydrolase n=1 Tax=Larsenimonas rhizosphaerae TaxID=2944682 RepID=A0AA41ZJS3_9GAMM|nr:cell wall hydrolase [Larsenimonas rhizosphaerae]MCM2131347.1 cell wall hydrolase [Larsenimonas rhizosphaerae]MCX2525288.1 cell wall hydrolase [Larsenimonas rhizosphaerae]
MTRRISLILGVLTMTLAPSLMAASSSQLAALAVKKAEILEQGASSSSPAHAPHVVLTKEGVKAADPLGQAPLDDPISCLSRSIYWEAKGAGRKEMEAVASVMMNRLGSSGFPDTICEVVQQGSETGHCQFSWWCDGRPDQVREPDEYDIAREIARRALNGTLPDPTHGALFFHQKNVFPYWADSFTKTAETRAFEFYRP